MCRIRELSLLAGIVWISPAAFSPSDLGKAAAVTVPVDCGGTVDLHESGLQGDRVLVSWVGVVAVGVTESDHLAFYIGGSRNLNLMFCVGLATILRISADFEIMSGDYDYATDFL